MEIQSKISIMDKVSIESKSIIYMNGHRKTEISLTFINSVLKSAYVESGGSKTMGHQGLIDELRRLKAILNSFESL
ncbi:hypothetical protein TH1_140 [Shewanella phage Thanatos-1]|nr:hypothetical protein TH1_140 [Shewanella phage Thanatos-1]